MVFRCQSAKGFRTHAAANDGKPSTLERLQELCFENPLSRRLQFREKRKEKMAKPTIKITETDRKVVEFEIPGGVTSPAEAVEAVNEIGGTLAGKLPVCITGRGPVWLFAMLVHAAHPSPAVATFDPRLGYVVVATHDERFPLGSVIE
jgi:CRISPR-associated protein Csx3